MEMRFGHQGAQKEKRENAMSRRAPPVEIETNTKAQLRLKRMQKKAFKKEMAELRTEIVPIDWSSKELQPFKRQFYEENPVTAARLSEEIEAYRTQHRITVDGAAPKPILTFEELECLPDFFTKATSCLDYQEPTPIQAHSWPIIMSGLNMACIAKPDSSQLLAYILPALVHIKNQAPLKKGDGPIVVVLLPTRESVMQANKAARQISSVAAVKTVAIFTRQTKQLLAEALKQQTPEIIFAQPQRLVSVLKSGLTNLQRCTFIVLDDLDMMFLMGFKDDIRLLLGQIRPDRQILMWTSLWTEKASHIAKDFFGEFVTVKADALKLPKSYTVQHTVEVCAGIEKGPKLKELLAKIYNDEKLSGTTLIFVVDKARADEVAQFVRACSLTCGVAYDYASKKSLSALEEGTKVIVATDRALCSIELNFVIEYVIIFDFPEEPLECLRRIDHIKSDLDGFVYTFFTRKNARHASSLIGFLREANQNVPPMLEQLSKGKEIGVDKTNPKTKGLGNCGIEDVISSGKAAPSEEDDELDDDDVTEGLYAGGGAGFGGGGIPAIKKSDPKKKSAKKKRLGKSGGLVTNPHQTLRDRFIASIGWRNMKRGGSYASNTGPSLVGNDVSRKRKVIATSPSNLNAREEANSYNRVTDGESQVGRQHASIEKSFGETCGLQANSLDGIGGDNSFGGSISSNFGNAIGPGVDREANNGRSFNSRSSSLGFNTNYGGGGFNDRRSSFVQQRKSNQMGASQYVSNDSNNRGLGMWGSAPSSSNYNSSAPEFGANAGGRHGFTGRVNVYGSGEKDNTTFNIRIEDGLNRSDGGFSGHRNCGLGSRHGQFGGNGGGEHWNNPGFGPSGDTGFGNRDDSGFGSNRDGRFSNRDMDSFGARGDSGMGVRHQGGFGGTGKRGLLEVDDGCGFPGDSGLGSRGDSDYGNRDYGEFSNKGNDGGQSNRNDVSYGRRNDALFTRRENQTYGNNRFGGPSDRDQKTSNANCRFNQHRPNNRGMNSGYGGGDFWRQ